MKIRLQGGIFPAVHKVTMQQKSLFAFVSFFLVACGGTDGAALSPDELGGCTVEQTEQGAVFTCGDGSSAVVSNGEAGLDGANGGEGKDGRNGADGADGLAGARGLRGANGNDGADGETGETGETGSAAVTRYVSCIAQVSAQTEVRVHIWDDGSNVPVGFCYVAEEIHRYSETLPLIDGTCALSLASMTGGVLRVQMETDRSGNYQTEDIGGTGAETTAGALQCNVLS